MRLIKTSLRRRLFNSVLAVSLLVLPFGCVVLFGTMTQSRRSSREIMYLDTDNVNGGISELRNKYDSEKLKVEEELRPEENIEPAPYGTVYDESAETINVSEYLKTLNLSESNDDLSVYTERSGSIIEECFGKAGGPVYISLPGGGQVRNCTELSAEKLSEECKVPSGITVERYSDEPQVLIMHTHTSESYEPYEKNWYDACYISRSASPKNGVVSVGEALAKELAAEGICVIHDCTVYDDPYNGAYTRSLSGTAELLERYPSIKIVLDIHRDAIEYSDGTRVSAVTEIDGKKAAQIMVICAADDGNYDVPDYLDNFHFACELQQETEKLFPTLTRPILFQYCQYNQQLSKGALLIEVGSHGNSTEQAVYTGELIGKALVSLLTGEQPELSEAVPALSSVPLYFLGRVI